MFNWLYNKNIKKSLFVSFILLLLIPMLIFNTAIIFLSYYQLKSSTFSDIRILSTKQADFFNQWIEERLIDIEMIASSENIQNLNILEAQNYFNRVLKRKQNHFYNLVLVNQNGQPLCVAYQKTTQNPELSYEMNMGLVKKLQNTNLQDRDYFQSAMIGRNYISDALIGKISDIPVVVFSVPIFKNNEFRGLVLGTITTKTLSNIINIFNNDSNSETYLVNQSDLMITESPYSAKLRLPDGSQNTGILNFEVTTKGIEKASAQQPHIGIYNNYRNEKIIGAYQLLPYHNWVLVTEKNYHKIFMNYWRRDMVIVMGFTLLTFLTAIPFILFLSRYLTKPLDDLVNLTMKISDGNWEYHLTPYGVEETQRLAHYFNKMTSKLQMTMEELEQKNKELNEVNRLKSEFIANVSHELRTPLNSIIGFTEMVNRKTKELIPDKQTKNLETVERNARHLLNLINQMLDLSKIESGKMDLFLEAFNICSLIDEICYLAYPLAEKKGLAISKMIPPDPVIIISDYAKLKQVLINIISNAIKFTQEGQITITLAPAASDIDGFITLKVRDTGQGITEENIEKIFDAFRQADGSMSRKIGGTGLGLTISRKLCQILNGKLDVISTYGKGSTFIITLPIDLRE